jgi:hypothetical protein
MRLPRTRDCGDLLLFDEVRRSLRLGRPLWEGDETIRVEDVVGTTGRADDFDGCFRPRTEQLAKRLLDIERANPSALDEPIEVVRVDRAYFVSDGHKRLSLAHSSGREFIDARVSVASTEYELTPGVVPEAIDSTARERLFLDETGLSDVPAARFAVSEPDDYAELKEAVESYGFELSHRVGRLMPREEASALWFECVYRPTVRAAHSARLDRLLRTFSDADLFLAIHRQSRRLWGTECRPAQDEADRLVSKLLGDVQREASVIGRIVRRARRRPPPELLPQLPASE